MVANWAFFVSPLLTDTAEQYKSFETQAIGRIRRYGQKKPVKVFRLLSKETIDISTYEQRSGKNVTQLVAAQLAVDPDSGTFPKTTLPLERVFIKREIKKGKKRKDDGSDAGASSDAEGSAKSTDDDDDNDKPAKKSKGKGKAPVKPKRAPAKKTVKPADSVSFGF